jgi:hypothetical protein
MDLFSRLLPYLNSPDRFIVAMVAIIFIWLAFDRARA